MKEDGNTGRDKNTTENGGKKNLPPKASLLLRLGVALYLLYMVYELRDVVDKYQGGELMFFIVAMILFGTVAVILGVLSARALIIGKYAGGALDTGETAYSDGIKEETRITVRQETPEDYEEVYELIREAFAEAEHADGNEQDLVTALRNGSAFIPELSLVAERNGKPAGHILFTKAKVGNAEVLVLAPLSVKPQYQRQGIGTALMKEGHRIAKELGYQYALVLGDKKYYERAGYLPAEQLGIEVPQGMPSESFLAMKLQEHAEAISGSVTYAKEFGL